MPPAGFIVVALLSVGALLAGQTPAPPSTVAPASPITTKSGLMYTVVAEGTGARARPGQTVLIHETLTLPDGRQIFTSRGKAPVKFLLGGNQVIPGVDEGVTGMRVGERRKLLVPPALDGRKFDPTFIPPDAIRHYDIELVEIVNDDRPLLNP
jgi:FKBP-type peptidyl-prolyl cis-trans isomerase